MSRPYQTIPRPDARELLPPLLACLSTASTSQAVPPALLPLLSPILRQRVQLLSSSEWLSLLCWNQKIGSNLAPMMEKMHVEPHPVSGEIEAEEPDQIQYRRSDSETMHSRLMLGQFGIAPVYLWCTGTDAGNSWLLSELRRLEDSEDGTQWFMSMSEADDAGFRLTKNGIVDQHTAPRAEAAKEDEDDDAYWAAYDHTPSQTPRQKPSPIPASSGGVQVAPSQSEVAYFARYASEVQPALDAHDPDEACSAMHPSTLDGSTLSHVNEHRSRSLGMAHPVSDGRHFSARRVGSHEATLENGASTHHNLEPTASSETDGVAALDHLHSTSSTSSSSVNTLGRRAESFSQAELAIKQHISTDIKSLFRLARAAGIPREEFEQCVQRELDILPLLEDAMS